MSFFFNFRKLIIRIICTFDISDYLKSTDIKSDINACSVDTCQYLIDITLNNLNTVVKHFDNSIHVCKKCCKLGVKCKLYKANILINAI